MFLCTHTFHLFQCVGTHVCVGVVGQIFTFSSFSVSLTNLEMEGYRRDEQMRGEKKRRKREQGRSEGVCVQVWDTARWIAQPNRQFITVRESERGRESRERKERECEGYRKERKGWRVWGKIEEEVSGG